MVFYMQSQKEELSFIVMAGTPLSWCVKMESHIDSSIPPNQPTYIPHYYAIVLSHTTDQIRIHIHTQANLL